MLVDRNSTLPKDTIRSLAEIDASLRCIVCGCQTENFMTIATRDMHLLLSVCNEAHRQQVIHAAPKDDSAALSDYLIQTYRALGSN